MADQPKRNPPSSSVVGEILGTVSTKRRRPDPTAIVIFGATGDLSGRKLAPALFNLLIDQSLTDPTVIIGVSRNPLTPQAGGGARGPRGAGGARRGGEPAAGGK